MIDPETDLRRHTWVYGKERRSVEVGPRRIYQGISWSSSRYLKPDIGD